MKVKAILEDLVKLTKLHDSGVEYTCNRPPGAAGASLEYDPSVKFGLIHAGVYPPDGSPTCKEVGCEIEYHAEEMIYPWFQGRGPGELDPHCVRTIHAEQRLIAKAARMGIMTDGATVYSILKPCYQCTKLLIAAGIKKIYYAGKAYDEERTRKILENAGVTCEHVDIGLEYGK